MSRCDVARSQAGFSMIEVLVTLVILVFGLLGLVGLQSRAQTAETESYQRVQALVLARDMATRINANRLVSLPLSATEYITGTTTPLGTGSTYCSPTPSTSRADVDLCEWDAALKGAAETLGGNNVGAMIGARGCITDVTPVGGTTKQYLIEVVWQGLGGSAEPPSSVACGSGLYGATNARRAVTSVVNIGNLN